MAITPSIYHVRYSDTTLTPIVIQPRSIDTTATSLTLPGAGRLDYGNFMDENVVHMLEHFSKATAPIQPISGQIWYKKDNKQLYVFNGSIWEPILTTINGTVPFNGNIDLQNNYRVINSLDPVNPQDAATKHYVDTTTVPNPIYVKKVGDTMTGPLTIDLTAGSLNQGLYIKAKSSTSLRIESTTGGYAPGIMLVNPDSAPTKYTYWISRDQTYFSVEGSTVDNTILDPAQNTIYFYVNQDGRIIAPLAIPTQPKDLTTKEYVDNADAIVTANANSRVARSGDTMTGFLTLNTNPINPLHAATKQYVDTAIAANGTNITYFGVVQVVSLGTRGTLPWTTFNFTPYIGNVGAKYGIIQHQYGVNDPDSGQFAMVFTRKNAASTVFTPIIGSAQGSRDQNSDGGHTIVPLTASQTFDLMVASPGFNSLSISLIGYIK